MGRNNERKLEGLEIEKSGINVKGRRVNLEWFLDFWYLWLGRCDVIFYWFDKYFLRFFYVLDIV